MTSGWERLDERRENITMRKYIEDHAHPFHFCYPPVKNSQEYLRLMYPSYL